MYGYYKENLHVNHIWELKVKAGYGFSLKYHAIPSQYVPTPGKELFDDYFPQRPAH